MNDPCAEGDARVYAAIRAVGYLCTQPKLIGLDFADVRSILDRDGEGGVAVVGHGIAKGPDRAVKAAEAALADLREQLAGLAAHDPG